MARCLLNIRTFSDVCGVPGEVSVRMNSNLQGTVFVVGSNLFEQLMRVG